MEDESGEMWEMWKWIAMELDGYLMYLQCGCSRIERLKQKYIKEHPEKRSE